MQAMGDDVIHVHYCSWPDEWRGMILTCISVSDKGESLHIHHKGEGLHVLKKGLTG